MNCYNVQLGHYLKSIEDFNKKINSITYISTYKNLNDLKILNEFTTCDYLICNNIKQYKHLTPTNLKTVVKPSCKIIIMEFFRFNGFYPLSPVANEHNIQIIDESFLNTNNYNEYINYKLDTDEIKKNFNLSLKKLKEMDEHSDVHIYDFFMENYKTKLLFRDHYHMSHILLIHIIKQLLVLLNIEISPDIVDNIPKYYTHGFKFRYRPILNSVKNVLSLKFLDDDIDFCNKFISKKQLYDVMVNNPNTSISDLEQKIIELN